MNFLVETKNEFNIRLINILRPHILEGFNSIYNDTKNLVIKSKNNKNLLKIFQKMLKNIPSWKITFFKKKHKE